MSKRANFLKALIAQQRSLGLHPAEIHMNAATVEDFSQEVADMQPDRRSVLDRLRGTVAPKVRLEMFDGVRVVENAHLAGSCIVLRPLQLMGDPAWLEHIHGSRPEAVAHAQSDVQQGGMAPWHQKAVDASPSPSVDDAVTVDSLTQGGGVNPSTVLFKALEDLDKIGDVIVLRFRKDKGVEICSTMGHFAVIGALQAALGYVAQGGE